MNAPAHGLTLPELAHTRQHHDGPQTAREAALELLSVHPRLSPAVIAQVTGVPHAVMCTVLWRAERSGVVRRAARGEYVLAPAAQGRVGVSDEREDTP